MTIELLHNTPLWVASTAIRTCWQSQDKSDTKFDDFGNPYWLEENENGNWSEHKGIGPKDRALIDRVGNQNKHASTLEHLVYSFNIEGISRACLQETSRHRLVSYSVKSTRYTLKELKDAKNEDLLNFVVNVGDNEFDLDIAHQLSTVREYSKRGYSNDKIKYLLPESYKTSMVMTINARSLQNFLHLRSSKSALWEIRILAYKLYDALPDEHKYLFKDYLYKEEPEIKNENH